MDTSQYVLTSMTSLRVLLVLAKRYCNPLLLSLPPVCYHNLLCVITTPCMPPLSLDIQPFEVTNYLSLYGVNEKCVNNLLSRYQEELIPDLYRYCCGNVYFFMLGYVIIVMLFDIVGSAFSGSHGRWCYIMIDSLTYNRKLWSYCTHHWLVYYHMI